MSAEGCALSLLIPLASSCDPSRLQVPLVMHASCHQSSADAGSRGRLFSSSCEEQPAVSWHRSLSRSRHDGREHVVVLAVVVPEGELVEVERQVPRGDVMEVAHDAALDQRPEAVNGAGMDFTADVLTGRVIHEVMGPLAAELKFIGRDQGDAIRDRLVHEAFQRLGVGRLDHLADHVSLAGDGTDDGDLAGRAAPTLAPLHPAADPAAVPVLDLAADVGFVHLDNAGELLEHRVLHRGADAMAHVPSGPVLAHADVPLHLQGAHALLGLAHDQDHLEPVPQGELGVLEDGAGQRGELVAVLRARLDHTGRRNGYVLHIDIRNGRPEIAAFDTVLRLESINDEPCRDPTPLKASGRGNAYQQIIWPRSHGAFDLLLAAEEGGASQIYLNCALDVVPRAPVHEGRGVVRLKYSTVAWDFPSTSFGLSLHFPLSEPPTLPALVLLGS